MRLWYLFLPYALTAFALTLGAQPQNKLRIDASTEEGRLLQQIGQQSDERKRQPLMEEFIAKYPKHPGLPWVAGQVQAIYLTQGEFDKALAVGEQALAVNPGDLDVAFDNLKAAEGRKDPELLKKWAGRTSSIARNRLASEKSPEELEHARQVDLYTEYAVYALALQMPDPAITVDLVEFLEGQNPKSPYLSKVYGRYFASLRSLSQGDKAGTKAERLADAGTACEDALLVAADYNLKKKTQPEKVIQYSARIAGLLNAKSKPEGLSDTEWETKKQAMLGVAQWMAGITYTSQGDFRKADQALRAALPVLVDEQARAVGLFNLGVADFQLGRAAKDKAMLQDALKYSEESAAIPGPLQIQAQKNVRAIRSELGMR